ncbi:MAG: type II toxin-antitoxin system RnlA family toxin [Flavobacterium sp.]
MKKLNLNRELYHSFIQDELSKTYQVSVEQKPHNLKICKFIKTGEKQAQLNIYENQDGTTTLHYEVGANPQLSQQIAEEILSISLIKEFRSHSFYIKSIRNEDFEVLIEVIVENGNSIESDKIENKKRIVTIKGRQGDRITITKHQNSAFQVQGKPKLLFNEIIEILSTFMSFDEIIAQQLSFYETNLTTADIRGELECRLPNCYPYIEDKLKIIITPSIALQKIEVELDDYSAFAFPVLRATEGVLKQIFLKNGKQIDNKLGFGEFIVKVAGKYTLTEEFEKELNNSNVSKKICNLYTFLNTHRHSLFHVDGLITTSKIINLQEASNIISTSLSIIDDCYDCLN